MYRKYKSIFAGSMGNLLEWYDFGLFSSLSFLFSGLFFPNDSPHIALIKIFGIYAVGFIFRPIGALILGRVGDLRGRVKALRMSILLMSLPTMLLAFLPTYDMIGVWAPMSLVVLRLLQGLSLGGEYTGLLIYLAESASPKHRALMVSSAAIFANLGFLFADALAAFLSHILTPAHFNAYGWRIGFLLGGMLGMGIFYMRRILVETEAFNTLLRQHTLTKNPILMTFRNVPGKMILTVSLVMLSSVLYYTICVYFFNWLEASGLVKSKAYLLQALFFAGMLMCVPMGAWICDRIGRRKSFLIMAGSVFLFAIPGMHLLESGHLSLICLALLIFMLLTSFEQGTTCVTVVEQFPAPVRYTGLSFSYNVSTAIFGGTAPLIAAYFTFVQHSVDGAALYLMAIAAVAFVSAFFFLKDTRGVSLSAI